jgi:hypothetical protein
LRSADRGTNRAKSETGSRRACRIGAVRTASSSRRARDGILARSIVAICEGAMKKVERWFYPGERVQVFYKSVGEWKDGIIRSMIRTPKQRSPNPSFYQVTVDGKENPRYYRPRELKLAVRAAAKPRRRPSPRARAA